MINITPFPAAEADTRTADTATNAAVDAPRAKPPGKKRIKAVKAPRAGGSNSRAKAAGAKPEPAPHVAKALSDEALAFLQEREHIIEQGRRGSIAMGLALYELQQYKKAELFRGRFESVADYALKRFDFDKAYTSMLLKTGAFVAECREKFTNVNKLPKSEGQIRSLLRLPKAERISLWEDTVKDRDADQVTGKLVAERALQRAEALGLKWAKPGTPKATPPAPPPATTQPAPSAPVETKTILQWTEPIPAVSPVESTPQGPTEAPTIGKPPTARPGQHIDEIIRAAIDHLDAVTKSHRRAIDWEVLITKCRRTLEY